jgi:hypothetical protein
VSVSAFELLKIGIGPSSSHTVGPMHAARRLAEALEADGLLTATERVVVALFGSLAAMGTTLRPATSSSATIRRHPRSRSTYQGDLLRGLARGLGVQPRSPRGT